MRRSSSCLSECAVKVADSWCLNHSVKPNRPLSLNHSVKPNLSSEAPISSIRNSVICIYKAKLSNQMQLTFIVTWCKNIPGRGICIDIIPHTSSSIEASLDHNIFDKEKGDRAIESCSSRFEVSWDLSAAKYNAEGPDPISNFHITVMIDSEIALRLGEAANVTGSPMAEFYLVSRREHLFGRTQYSTKAQLCDSGAMHDIVIRCTGNGKGKACRDPELSICIDEMQVICERSLQWKFRGNQVIYIDGQLVDVMWNFFDWFFNKGSSKTGSAVFMFRRRNGFHRSLWFEEQLELQEKTNLQECGGVEFSLMIYACKRP
ncbi:hypothetical protein Syun_016454 [Stephania yunnanensis]|uniref:Uncharacterized protein n=1 Tax=Stephania yunnanensis TaxID=152371 RepID=A0AAP0P1F9_9MAGN